MLCWVRFSWKCTCNRRASLSIILTLIYTPDGTFFNPQSLTSYNGSGLSWAYKHKKSSYDIDFWYCNNFHYIFFYDQYSTCNAYNILFVLQSGFVINFFFGFPSISVDTICTGLIRALFHWCFLPKRHVCSKSLILSENQPNFLIVFLFFLILFNLLIQKRLIYSSFAIPTIILKWE